MPRKYTIHDYDPNHPQKQPPKKARARLWEVKAFPRSKPTDGPASFLKPSEKWPDFTRNPRPDLGGKAAFKAWVKHYVDVVGYYVSVLNGLQFDLDEHATGGGSGKRDILVAFAGQIDEFATALHILKPEDYSSDPANPNGNGKPNFPKDPLAEYPLNPTELIWPLTNHYYFRYHFRRATDPAAPVPIVEYDYYVDLWLLFDTDTATNLCTNCELKLRISDTEDLLDKFAAPGDADAIGTQDPDYVSSSSSLAAMTSSSSG